MKVTPVVCVLYAACGGRTTVSASGNAFLFAYGGRLEGATVSILESPDLATHTDEQGGFRLDGLSTSSDVTFFLEHPDWVSVQTGTMTLQEHDIERVTFQVVDQATYDLLEAVLDVKSNSMRCQMASTVTRAGVSIYESPVHGEAGATVMIDPPIDLELGPIYFNSSVIPDRSLSETSVDGGVLFVNVPPGEYWLTAHKKGVAFAPVHVQCRAGILVNASPPWGIQAQ